MLHKAIFLICCSLSLLSCKPQSPANSSDTVTSSDVWEVARQIEESVVVPTFLDQTFDILDYGAVQDDEALNTAAFSAAVKACSEAGGGTVLVPEGVFYSGPIHLLDNVNLHLEEGAEIRFSTDPDDFLPVVHTSWEGTELMNYSPLIYAYGKTNIAVTGKGTLNGQADTTNWWTWKGNEEYGWREGMPSQLDETSRDRLVDLAEEGVPVSDRIFGENHYLRPSFVEFFECQNILIQGVKLIHAPFWVLHPIKSEHITIEGVTIESHGPNNDGCDPEYCKNVVIKNCQFNTGDDCIAIKSGRDADGRRVDIPSENIVVKDCRMIDGHGGVVMGSEMSAGIRNVFVENCRMDSPNLDRAIRIKTNTRRGGFVRDVHVRNLEVGQVKEALLRVNLFYGIYANQEGDFMPVVENISLENVRVNNSGQYVILAKGYASSPIRNITFNNVIIEHVEEAFSLENLEGLEVIDTYINGSLIRSPAEEL